MSEESAEDDLMQQDIQKVIKQDKLSDEILLKFSTGGKGIDDYELLRQVGKGGFSRVILAR